MQLKGRLEYGLKNIFKPFGPPVIFFAFCYIKRNDKCWLLKRYIVTKF